MESKRARKPPDWFVPLEGGSKQTTQTLKIKMSRNDMDSKRLRKPPARFVPWKEGDKHAPQALRKKKSKKKQEQKRYRELRKEKELVKEGRGTLHVEVNEDKDLRHLKGKPANKTKETNCGKKGKGK